MDGEQVAWGVGDEAPLNEGSDDVAVGEERIGERKAGEATGQDATGGGSDGDELPWGEDESAHPGPAHWGDQPNLEPDPPVAGRPTRLSPGSTDDSPGTPS
jgi:hypothetical protein